MRVDFLNLTIHHHINMHIVSSFLPVWGRYHMQNPFFCQRGEYQTLPASLYASIGQYLSMLVLSVLVFHEMPLLDLHHHPSSIPLSSHALRSLLLLSLSVSLHWDPLQTS